MKTVCDIILKINGLLLVFFSGHIIHAQNYPRDTSFSIRSETIKVQKKYPAAVPVSEFSVKNIIEVRNTIYKVQGDHALSMDIFRPYIEGNGLLPVVVMIHGGGWASGDKSHLIPLAQKIAENGFAASTIEYRLSPEAKYPAALQDISCAVYWIIRNRALYNIDTSKIMLLGCSSGGQLATLAGQFINDKKFIDPECGKAGKVRAIINIDGILDFTHPAESAKDTIPGNHSAASRWLGTTLKETPSLWKSVSPVNNVHKDMPPVLFLNSLLERFHAGRDQMIELMNEYGIYSEVYIVKDSPHAIWLFYPWFDEVYVAVIKFLSKFKE
ncbi:MAG: alpha/beta hydrolase [Melioribacteraceae bacterium]|nr:alpha/beta hydrolase [Melioribacteraceae bacterium]